MLYEEEEFILEDDHYWLYKFDEFTLHVPKIYESIKGFDRDLIYQNQELNTEDKRLPLFDTKEYSSNKWNWINEHCVVRGNDLYYTPKKIESMSITTTTTSPKNSDEYVCCVIC